MTGFPDVPSSTSSDSSNSMYQLPKSLQTKTTTKNTREWLGTAMTGSPYCGRHQAPFRSPSGATSGPWKNSRTARRIALPSPGIL